MESIVLLSKKFEKTLDQFEAAIASTLCGGCRRIASRKSCSNPGVLNSVSNSPEVSDAKISVAMKPYLCEGRYYKCARPCKLT